MQISAYLPREADGLHFIHTLVKRFVFVHNKSITETHPGVLDNRVLRVTWGILGR